MEASQHILLFVDTVDGKPVREPVHVVALSRSRFRLLHSPGLVQGIAAGDEFELSDQDGHFVVRARGGNLAVQVYASSSVAAFRQELTELVNRIGGVLDGGVDNGLVFTIPISAGFVAIELLFNQWTREHDGWEWYYGNVYDPSDGITPLKWWEPSRSVTP